jgi:hypothetical protein
VGPLASQSLVSSTRSAAPPDMSLVLSTVREEGMAPLSLRQALLDALGAGYPICGSDIPRTGQEVGRLGSRCRRICGGPH